MNDELNFKVANPTVAAGLLFDVVVFAGGTASGLNPLCDSGPKPMLNIGNRPMIWYCLRPWIQLGCRTFFICVNEDYAALQSYICGEFPHVQFVFVLVNFYQNEIPTTTADAVNEYLKAKKTLPLDKSGKPDVASEPRDALLVSCDTFIPGVDIEPFVSNFYSSAASVSVMLFRPSSDALKAQQQALMGPQLPASGRKQQQQSAHQQHQPTMKPYVNQMVCAAYEEEDQAAAEDLENYNRSMGGSTSMMMKSTYTDPNDVDLLGSGVAGAKPPCHHHRLHFFCPLEDSLSPKISTGFAFRRPNLTFCADLADVHVYLVRRWALDYMAQSAGQVMTLRRDLIPLLARSQYAVINTAKDAFISPGTKIGHEIDEHWVSAGSSLAQLNAVAPSRVPDQFDTLRVFCTIYDECPSYPMKMYRAKTRDAYLAINHELILGRCLQCNINPFETDAKAQPQKQNAAAAAHPKGGKKGPFNGGEDKNSPKQVLPPLSATALCDLLPEMPISFNEKDEERRVMLTGTLIRSVPTRNAFITRSVVGNNVRIGNNVRLTNSVILDNVELEDNCVVTNSVIGASSVIASGVKVVNATVGPQRTVKKDEIEG